jgi:site-specific recombinase XerD
MYRNGATLKEVADILGHDSIDTTAIYTKIKMSELREVPLQWPGGQL